MNDDDDTKKPLPRERWANEAERAKEAKRVSQLLDAESGQANDAPVDDQDLTPVYGAPEDDQPSRPEGLRVYGMPATRRPVVEPASSPAPKSGNARLAMFIVGVVVVAAALLWWFTLA